MENTLIDNQMKETLKVDSTSLRVQLGRGYAYAFSIILKNEEELKNIWETISNFIAINFQAKIKDQFSKWNIYLFFQIQENIGDDLKYKIENSTFSSRKIVIEGKESLSTLISCHILNNDLKIEKGVLVIFGSFNRQSELWNLLDGKVLKKRHRIDAAQDVFNELLKLKRATPDENKED
ncbi:ABC-three component system middle component 1 [[Flexibacter] sp. ATCC 35208]|uniref:ABC-three component system middle component 1 n=1 Tax=[Flexibacter] sp. ATCC 35208 TaxID=1936242 RepID=UPI0009D1F3F1|nr:ABC-three component system middle component 1 [[Flexibacter] sp. ATCC 35208]OMP74733.1 hypothetical protein BW716_33800 [[Flexibacter] sp. ATCC 35208]